MVLFKLFFQTKTNILSHNFHFFMLESKFMLEVGVCTDVSFPECPGFEPRFGPGFFLCGLCMFSSCFHGFSRGTLVSSLKNLQAQASLVKQICDLNRICLLK